MTVVMEFNDYWERVRPKKRCMSKIDCIETNTKLASVSKEGVMGAQSSIGK